MSREQTPERLQDYEVENLIESASLALHAAIQPGEYVGDESVGRLRVKSLQEPGGSFIMVSDFVDNEGQRIATFEIGIVKKDPLARSLVIGLGLADADGRSRAYTSSDFQRPDGVLSGHPGNLVRLLALNLYAAFKAKQP